MACRFCDDFENGLTAAIRRLVDRGIAIAAGRHRDAILPRNVNLYECFSLPKLRLRKYLAKEPETLVCLSWSRQRAM